MHEVGHTLGPDAQLQASTVYTRAQLQDKDFTEKNGISGSVMDYNAYNIAAGRRAPGELQQHHARPLRLLGDRVRLQADRAGRREAPSSRASPRAAPSRCWPSPTTRTPAAARATTASTRWSTASTSATTRWPTTASACSSRASCGSACRSASRSRATTRHASAACCCRGFSPLNDAAVHGRQVRRRHVHRARRCRAPAAHAAFRAGRAGTPARGAAVPRQRPVLGRQLPLQAAVPGQPGARLPRVEPRRRRSASRRRCCSCRRRRWTACSARAPPRGCSTCRCTCRAASARDLISLNEVYGTRAGAVWSELKTGGEIDRLRRNLQREHLQAPAGAAGARSARRCRPMRRACCALNAVALQAELRQALAQRQLVGRVARPSAGQRWRCSTRRCAPRCCATEAVALSGATGDAAAAVRPRRSRRPSHAAG